MVGLKFYILQTTAYVWWVYSIRSYRWFTFLLITLNLSFRVFLRSYSQYTSHNLRILPNEANLFEFISSALHLTPKTKDQKCLPILTSYYRERLDPLSPSFHCSSDSFFTEEDTNSWSSNYANKMELKEHAIEPSNLIFLIKYERGLGG